ncbi:MAG: hypothetical protein JXA83_11510 [Acidimicrobiales bacterium]|nr:hypothetical protein [Acidimicrobiales bacterium]
MLVAVAPFVVAIATRAGRDYVPVGDIAVMDLRVRDVWSSDVPLVGAYSRFGWNHPGPAGFYLLAPVSTVSGQPAWATLVGHALLQATVVAAIGWVAWRTGGLARLLAVLALVGLAFGAMGPSMVLDAWNPNVAYPMFVLFVLLAWVLSYDTPRALPAVAVVGTVLVQSHLGYLPLVAAATALAVVLCVRDGHRWTACRRPAAWTLVALVVLWTPPLVHELVHPSNVRRLVRAQVDPAEPVLGLSRAAGVFAEEFRVPPPWLGGEHRLDEFANTVVPRSAWWLVIPVVLLIVATLATRRRRARGSAELLALTTTLAVVGLVSIARVVGPAERYVFYWRVPLALLVVFVTGWTLWLAAHLDEHPQARRIAGGALAAVVVVASATLSVRIAQVDDVSDAEPLAQEALAAAEASLDDDRRVLVRAAGVGFLGIERTIVNELERDGADVVVDDDLGYLFGYSRTATPDDVDEVWYVLEGGEYLSVLSAAPGARVLWVSSPLSTAEEQDLQARQRELWSFLQRAGREELFNQLESPVVGIALADLPGIDRAVLDRVADLNTRVRDAAPCRCAIVAFDPEDASTAAAGLPNVDG